MKKFLILLLLMAAIDLHAQDTVIHRLEYFLDTDPGFGNATTMNVSAAAIINFTFTIDLENFSVGHHNLFFRIRDDLGRWSQTVRRTIEVLPSEGKINLAGGEYFIDTDPGFGSGVAINLPAPDSALGISFDVASTGLSKGYHKLYLRFRDENGDWSQSVRRNFEVITDENRQLVRAEYFFKTDMGFGSGNSVVFATPLADGTFQFTIPAAELPKDSDTIQIRVLDNPAASWSITSMNDFSAALPLTLLSFSGSKKENNAVLNWTTTNEFNTSHFFIERSLDATKYEQVGRVESKNNGSLLNQYEFVDDISNISTGRIYYRLRQVDIDGRFEYSKIISILNEQALTGIRLSPNPARGYVFISSSEPRQLKGANLTIVDVQGRVVKTQLLTEASTQRIDLTKFVKGVYIVSIQNFFGRETYRLLVE